MISQSWVGQAVPGPWQSWTTTWANLTVGNGSVVSKYIQIGKTVHYRIHVTLGSTSSIGGLITFTPPVSANSECRGYMGWVRFVDASSTDYSGPVLFSAVTEFVLYSGRTNVDHLAETATSGSSPIPWASTDEIQINGTYEAA